MSPQNIKNPRQAWSVLIVSTLAFTTTDRALVRLRTTDAVGIRAWATFSYRVAP